MAYVMSDPELVESLRYLSLLNDENSQSKLFDSKVNRWIPDLKEGFIPIVIETTKGNESVVKIKSGDFITVNNDNLLQMNSSNHEKCEDMANMTYLNDATILHNLQSRYQSNLIYVNLLIY